MEFIKTLFDNSNLRDKTQEKGTSKEISQLDNKLKILEEQINTLINISLSALPNTSNDVIQQQSSIATCLKKIIFHFNLVLLDKLKVPKSPDNKNKLHGLSASASSPENSDKKKETVHYWDFISKFFQIPSVKFINNIYENLQNSEEKGLTWICISILENSFKDSMKDIYTQGFEVKFYMNDSLVIEKKHEILELVDKLSKASLFNPLQLEIYREYEHYKKLREWENKDNIDNMGIDLPIVSPITRNRGGPSDHFINTPFLLTPQNGNALYGIYLNKY